MMNNVYPHSVDAEQAVLGALLIYNDAVEVAYEQGLQEEDFYQEAHRTIYRVMMDLMEVGQPIDPNNVISRLEDRKELALAGNADYIIDLMNTAISSANVKSYIENIKDKSKRRMMIAVADRIRTEGFDTSLDLEELLDQAEKQVLSLTRNRRVNDFQSSKVVVKNVIENIEMLRKSPGGITGVETGYTELDSITNGFQRGDLIILAARPSVGKTAFALNLGLNASKRNREKSGGVVAIFSLEMPNEQLIRRMLSAQGSIKGDTLRTGKLNNDEMNRLFEAAQTISAINLFTDDSSSIKMAEIFSKCRKLKADMDDRLDLVIIDYLQLITGSGKRSGENRQQEVSEISRSLKMLARELNVPVIALSQLSRSVEQRTGDKAKPMLSDLRESGAIEQDADIVMFLSRDDYQKTDDVPADDEDSIDVEVSIQKHRNGRIGNFNLKFQKSINKFVNIVNTRYEGGYQ
ncbi:replicative DNA helicase [Breznakia sp. PH1-1]|uniref:replicative DNA helicase n=1 Tax=Breznakia sp. PFB1-11 TaxID=2940521 RepID=UPI00247C25A3|nr:replicative DNA helicase [Breznakia sp. PH1-1]MDH6405249.1 replicative DNA helicase [Breznakia sp. PF1-11]MDH6412961.1 replicative DNA helicase [Breznakia sp. PFB1-11]MDH6415325.1 replicative DNA helicase [Breznakia sp. PFB1-14]MDH6417627.1 replicative DNA helicase [Breznakia sp. PFB1-4]MDH6419996.1 replicative DNA helicase [Breznakia sp. PFB1-12]MDH6475046.1 replicative DNA helicase [Breznakia sp. PFB2-30]MDH6477369.1 replicative DNA helicase [Breznakia sp. PFB1-19]